MLLSRTVRTLALTAGVLVLAGKPAWAQAPGGDATKGAQLFDDRCSYCHTTDGTPAQGPNLIGVVGRKAGAVPGYSYSPALKAFGQTWTAANLDSFLSGPAVLVPGTAMSMSVADGAQRADLIAYLASLKGP
jgi:cytochrome c